MYGKAPSGIGVCNNSQLIIRQPKKPLKGPTTLVRSPEPVTLICSGPVPDVASALEKEPRIVERARLVGMHASVRRGYNGKKSQTRYNVAQYLKACRQAFAAPWDVTITPLDTCGIVRLEGEKYRAVRDCNAPLAQALIDNYRIWAEKFAWAT